MGTDQDLDNFDGNSISLITVCQAVHWFPDIEQFYERAKRVLKPGGVLAVFGYLYSRPAPNVLNFEDLQQLQQEVNIQN